MLSYMSFWATLRSDTIDLLIYDTISNGRK
jgi:hypothetical protein